MPPPSLRSGFAAPALRSPSLFTPPRGHSPLLASVATRTHGASAVGPAPLLPLHAGSSATLRESGLRHLLRKSRSIFFGWRLPLRRHALPIALRGARPVARIGCSSCLAFTGTPRPPHRLRRAQVSLCAPWVSGFALGAPLCSASGFGGGVPPSPRSRGTPPPLPLPARFGRLVASRLPRALRYASGSASLRDSGVALKGAKSCPLQGFVVALRVALRAGSTLPLFGRVFFRLAL